jgi:hypothetical protein
MGATWRAPLYVQNNGAYFYEPGGWTEGRANGSGASPAAAVGGAPASTLPTNVEAFH